jgi:hypothetical protein
MERQAGLGRSLEDVLDSLTPVEPDPAGAARVLFEPEDLEQQLDTLMADIAALRERVHHLIDLLPDDAVLRVVPEPVDAAGKKNKKRTKKQAKKSGKAKKKSAKRGR